MVPAQTRIHSTKSDSKISLEIQTDYQKIVHMNIPCRLMDVAILVHNR